MECYILLMIDYDTEYLGIKALVYKGKRQFCVLKEQGKLLQAYDNQDPSSVQ